MVQISICGQEHRFRILVREARLDQISHAQVVLDVFLIRVEEGCLPNFSDLMKLLVHGEEMIEHVGFGSFFDGLLKVFEDTLTCQSKLSNAMASKRFHGLN